MLDFGNAGHLELGQRRALVRLFFASVNRDADLAIDALRGVGDVSGIDQGTFNADIRKLFLDGDQKVADLIEGSIGMAVADGMKLPTDLLALRPWKGIFREGVATAQ